MLFLLKLHKATEENILKYIPSNKLHNIITCIMKTQYNRTGSQEITNNSKNAGQYHTSCPLNSTQFYLVNLNSNSTSNLLIQIQFKSLEL